MEKDKTLIKNPKNQDGHLTLIDNLKKCSKCGDYLEFIRPDIVINGNIIYPAKKMNQFCYCQAEEIKKEQEKKEQEKQKRELMERYKVAEIPPRFLNWNFKTIDDSENKKICQRYVDCFDVNRLTGNGLFMVGDKGTGKTTLAVCMLKELIKNGYSVMIISFTEILNRITSTYAPNSLKTQRQIIDDLLKFDFLILDDFGREAYTDKRLELAFQVIDELCKNMKCIAITANPEMIQQLKSPDPSDKKAIRYAEAFKAILDRLNEMCKIQLVFKGESFRKGS